MEVLDAISRTGTTIVMATHNEEIVNSMRKRVVELNKGSIVRDEKNGSYDSAMYFPDEQVAAMSHAAIKAEVGIGAVAGTAASMSVMNGRPPWSTRSMRSCNPSTATRA